MAAPNQPIDVDAAMYQNVDAPGLLAFHQLLQQWQVWQQQQQQHHAEFFNQLVNIQGYVNSIQGHVNNIQDRVNTIQDRVNNIQASIDRIPIQLYNPKTTMDSPLLYPPGIVPTLPLPLTKWDLYRLSAAACNASFVRLGLPPVAAEVPLEHRRQALMKYFREGCWVQHQST